MHSAVYVQSVQWMMGNTVQCDVWCESQYDGEATSFGSRTKDHEPDSWHTYIYIYIYIYIYKYSGGKIIWSPADFVRLPTDKEMISL